MILGAAVVLVEVAMIYFSLVSSSKNQETYKNLANNLSATVAKVVDVEEVTKLRGLVEPIVNGSETLPFSEEWGSPEWEAYVAQFDDVQKSEPFLNLRSFLREIESANSDEIDCLYLSYVDREKEAFVYLVDSAEEDPCPPGCLDYIYDVNRETLDNLKRGFPAYITDTPEYGWLVTAGTAVCAGDNVVCYAMVDISMQRVRQAQADSIVRLFVYMAITVVILGALAMLIVDLTLIRPLRALNNAASTYDVQHPERNKETFDNLLIRNHDEIGQLADSIKTMEGDVRNKIQELTKTNDQLAHSQRVAAEMTELANKDALTGIRNKTAFDHDAEKANEEIASGRSEPFGVAMIDLNYLKTINDERGHRKGDVALIKLSNLICATFAHSRVYRVGGDEFVAVLRKSDYANSAALIAEFNEKIKGLHGDMDLSLEERVSAAIGYSEYRPGKDRTVASVLNRADAAMYGKKREMKKEDGQPL